MDNKKLYELSHNFIVTASQFAYISHDITTYELLRNIDGVFLYFSKSMKTVVLFNEIQILEKYIYIQKIRYGNRFTLNVSNDEEYKNYFITHLSVIEFFDRILEMYLDQYEGEISFTLKFDMGTSGSISVALSSDRAKETFRSNL